VVEVRRKNVYTLRYYRDDVPDETVRAYSPAAAVAARQAALMPATITDRTALDHWVKRRIALQQTTRTGA
jgi:hypothetical protein